MPFYFKTKFLSHWSYEKIFPSTWHNLVPFFQCHCLIKLFLQAQKPHFKIDVDFPIHANTDLLCGLMTVLRMQKPDHLPLITTFLLRLWDVLELQHFFCPLPKIKHLLDI